jgi:hypothetical protein
MQPLNATWHDEWWQRAYRKLAETLRGGTDGVRLEYGKHVWEVFDEKPQQGRRFNEAMTSFSRASGAAILEAYDFSRHRNAGEQHAVAAAHIGEPILGKYPEMQGVLFDRAPVMDEARGSRSSPAISWPPFHQAATRS